MKFPSYDCKGEMESRMGAKVLKIIETRHYWFTLVQCKELKCLHLCHYSVIAPWEDQCPKSLAWANFSITHI